MSNFDEAMFLYDVITNINARYDVLYLNGMEISWIIPKLFDEVYFRYFPTLEIEEEIL